MTSGCRSGSKKLVMQFYGIMVKIWDGAPATEPLPFGVQLAVAPNTQVTDSVPDYDPQIRASLFEDEATTQDSAEASLSDVDDDENVSFTDTGGSNRKRTFNMVPALNDNKREHMERQLSLAQRDKILLQESKDEKEFRSELSTSLKESNALFAKSMKVEWFHSCISIILGNIQITKTSFHCQPVNTSFSPHHVGIRINNHRLSLH